MCKYIYTIIIYYTIYTITGWFDPITAADFEIFEVQQTSSNEIFTFELQPGDFAPGTQWLNFQGPKI